VLQLFVLAASIVAAWAGASAAAGTAAKLSTQVVHLNWREVVSEPSIVVTNNRYVAIATCIGGGADSCAYQLSLLDEALGQQEQLSVPGGCGPYFIPVGFGGPYLAGSCVGGSSWLYDLDTQQWQQGSVPSDCSDSCTILPVGNDPVGRYWLKLEGSDCDEHCGASYFLKNLQTGQVERDPALAGGTTLDDLNSPTGTARLCAPLRYPTSNYDGPGPGTLEFSGPFALAHGTGSAYRLERCGSRHFINIDDVTPAYPPPISSSTVAWVAEHRDHCKKRMFGLACTSHFYIELLSLYAQRRLAASLPTAPTRYGGVGEVVGLTQRTIWVEAPTGSLWEAALPDAGDAVRGLR
jgi:hypothetical protein